MRASLFLSAVLCSLAFQGTFGLGDEPPYMDTLREIVYETNEYLKEKHLDVVDIPKTEYSNFVSSLNVVGGTVENFASAQLVGDSYLNETEEADKTVYYFSIGVGLTDLKIQLQYKAKVLGVFSSSGTVNIINTGNAAVAVGTISTSGKGTSYKCEVELESVNVKKVGDIALDITPSSVFHWIMEKSSNLILRVAAPYASSVIDSTIQKISQQDQVKEILTTVMCRLL
ncbi:uncharacterized protein [Halyomorpha halys]|uniref:uncharacterized protein n=1 Tax=Halyomorpha halys TaxID=286706 RepID=UPI0006D4ED11|nr:uncharacterized protein LOC106683269 [Halyomorpha halys]